MAKLGLTMEDIKEAQKQAAAKKASDKSGAQASGQKNGSNAANTAKKREEQKGKTVRAVSYTHLDVYKRQGLCGKG